MSKNLRGIILGILICMAGFFSLMHADLVKAASSSDKYVIVLDPGHGGAEAGAGATFNGITYNEEEITWKLANYVKEELAKCPNIEVHLTRDIYYYKMGLSERVQVGYEYNADLLVSLHIDSSDSPAPSGGSLLISNGNYRPELAEKEKILGDLLKTEFTQIGLNWRGCVVRNSSNGSTYPNGKIRDYYGIVAGSVEKNLVGVILEHCFISNPSDVSNFLSSDKKIKKLAVADANAIVAYCKKVDKVEERTGWFYQNGDYYYYQNGAIVKNKLLKLSDGKYYVDGDGKRISGFKTVNGYTYYFSPQTGLAKKGWMTLNKKKYYFSSGSGVMFQNVLSINTKTNVTRYFDKDGVLAVNKLVTFKGQSYYMNSTGQAVKGFKKIDGKTYYFASKDKHMVKSKKLTNSKGNIYYLDEKGVRAENKFVRLQEGSKQWTYYFGSNGIAYKGWHTIEGKKYYFNAKGRMARNVTLTNSKGRVTVFDENGVLINSYYKK